MKKYSGIGVFTQESPHTVLLEQPAQQIFLLSCGLLRSHTCCSSSPRSSESTPDDVTPQAGIPPYKHQRCPCQLLPSSPSGSQWSFLSVSAGDVLFQTETKSLLKPSLSSNICFIFCLKQRPAPSNLSLLSSLAWSSESCSLHQLYAH